MISRETVRHGGRDEYRAVGAGVARERPKRFAVERSLRLRTLVCRQLGGGCSPALIAGRLLTYYPDDQACRVAHEAIYQ